MIVLLLLLAHLVADFWFQTDRMVNNKIKHLNKHLLHHLFTTGIALAIICVYQYEFRNIINYFIFPLLFIYISHLFIDLLKIKLVDSIIGNATDSLIKLGFFLLDQVLHISMLLITCIVFFDMEAAAFATRILELYGPNSLSTVNILLLFIVIFILATSVSGHIVKFIVGTLPSEFTNYEGELTLKNQIVGAKEKTQLKIENSLTEEYHYFTYSTPLRSRGKLIGYIERLLVILLTIIGAYPSIAFIIAAKSIARFKQLDDRNWAEYFLLGTLSSIFLGLMLGLVAKGMVM